MDQVEHQVKDLETQGMSPEQYKDSIGKFKVHFYFEKYTSPIKQHFQIITEFTDPVYHMIHFQTFLFAIHISVR